MKKYMKRIVALILIGSMVAPLFPDFPVLAMQDVPEKSIEYVEEDFFLPIIVDGETVTQGSQNVDYIVEDEEVLVNAESLMCDTIDMDEVKDADVVEEDNQVYVSLEDVAEECNIEVVEEGEKTVYVKPYQTKRLIVEAEGKIPDVHPQNTIVEEDYLILEFATEEETEKAFQTLQKSKNVAHVTGENVYATVGDPTGNCLEGDQLSWGADYVNSQQVAAYAETLEEREEVVVAVVDTGVQMDHPYLKDRIHEDSAEARGVFSVDDKNGHGTHVAGIVAANTPDNVSVLAVRSLNSNGESTDSWLAQGINYAVNHGADIINMSWGGYTYWTEDVLKTAIKNAYDAGVVLIAASGNESDNASQYYPASSKYCITVASSDPSGCHASFSNYGSCVDISAPGVDIYSTYLNSTYKVYSGTSMSTPFVAAACATEQTLNGKRSPEDMKACITSHVTPFSDGCTNRGSGIVDFTPSLPVECVQPVTFSQATGYYEDAITVELSCATEDAQLYYTLDEINGKEGANPSEERGIPYTGPITIRENTVLRAAAYKDGLFQSKVSKAIYRYNDYDRTGAYLYDEQGCLTGYTGVQKKLEIPQEIGGITITKIGDEVFKESNIEQLILPDTVTSIGDDAFYESNLKKIVASEVAELGAYCFYKAEQLKTIEMNSLRKMGQYCFAYTDASEMMCDLTEIESIAEGAFMQAKVQDITAPSVEDIGEKAFYKCSKLNRVSVENVKTIRSNAFYNATVKHIDMPIVENIESHAFEKASYLEEIHCEVLQTVASYAFMACSRLYTIDLPNVTKVSYSAFDGCNSVRVIHLPKAVYVNLNSCNTGNLTELSLPSALYIYGMNSDSLKRIYAPECLQISGFNNCPKLEEIKAPKVCWIKDAFHYRTKIESACWPNTIAVEASFFYHSTLRELVLPKTMTMGTYGSELLCDKLSYLYLPQMKRVENVMNRLRNAKNIILTDCEYLQMELDNDFTAEMYTPNLRNLYLKTDFSGVQMERKELCINAPKLESVYLKRRCATMALPKTVAEITQDGLDALEEPLLLYSNNESLVMSGGSTNYVVENPPVIKTDLPEHYEVAEDNYVLHVAAYCADAKYVWYYSPDGDEFEALENHNRSKLTPQAEGTYYCRIIDNESGNYVDTEKCQVTFSVLTESVTIQFQEPVTLLFDDNMFTNVKEETFFVPLGKRGRIMYDGTFEHIVVNDETEIGMEDCSFWFDVTDHLHIREKEEKILTEENVEILGIRLPGTNIFEYDLDCLVQYEGHVLEENTDYRVAFLDDLSGTNNKVFYRIEGIGAYSGIVAGVFQTEKISVEDCEIRMEKTFLYTGEAITPEVQVFYQGEPVPKRHYTITCRNNMAVGTGEVIVQGIGLLKEEITLNFDINMLMSEVNAELLCDEYIYDGQEKYPKFHVSCPGGNVTYKWQYIDNVNAGTATLRLTGTGYFSGTIDLHFKILPRSLEECLSVPDNQIRCCTGEAVVPNINAGNLLQDTDYTVSCQNNIYPGTATYTVTGIGNYAGTIKGTFELYAVPIEQWQFSLEKYEWYDTGKTIGPKVICNYYKEGIDYTVRYKRISEQEQGYVLITGKGIYSGTVDFYYNFLPCKPNQV